MQEELDQIQRKMETDFVFDDLASEKDLLCQREILMTALECYDRGIAFRPADSTMSEPRLFVPEDGTIRIPFGHLGER